MPFPNTVQFFPDEPDKTLQRIRVNRQLLHLARKHIGEKYEYETVSHLASHLLQWSDH